MIFVHGFLAWFTAHCWGSRLGAKWMQRVEPAWANSVFVSARFLRFCVILSAIEAADVIFIITQAATGGVPLSVLICLALGTASGVILGRAAYG